MKTQFKDIKALRELVTRLLFVQIETTGAIQKVDASKNLFSMQVEKIQKKYIRFFEESLGSIQKAGMIRVADGKVETLVPMDSSLPAGLWEEWEAVKKEFEDDPSWKAQFTLLEVCLKNLPGILTGKIQATQVMFPGGSMDMVSAIYKTQKTYNFVDTVVADIIRDYVEARIKMKGDDIIRIIEIGAGTGSTSSRIFNKIKKYPDNLEYCYTDISKSFLLYAQENYGKENPYLKYKIWNIEKESEEQGIEEGYYDIAVASNVLHATKNIRQTLRNAKKALSKNGIIIINEMMEKTLFATLTFGLLDGWWLYEDPGLRIPGSPLLSFDSWKKALEEEGFQQVRKPKGMAEGMNQKIVLAESNGLVIQKNKTKPSVQIKIKLNRPDIKKTESPAVQADLQVSHITRGEDPNLKDKIRNILRGQLAQTVKVPVENIKNNSSFSEYGMDSIMSVSFVKKLNDSLHLELNSAVLFDYATLDSLCSHLYSDYKEIIGNGINGSSDLENNGSMPPVQEINRMIAQGPVETEGKLTCNHLSDIAVIGMSGQFPEAENYREFWNNLLGKRNSVTELPEEFLDEDAKDLIRSGQKFCRWGGVLKNKEYFDPLFFNIAPVEALSMNINQRLVLQESWKSLEDAGYNPEKLNNQKVSLFIGAEPAHFMNKSFTGYSDAIVASRLSYYLNLKGPAMVVNTACSSSASSVHLACESLRNNESSMSIAGGVFANLTPTGQKMLTDIQMLSPSGKCRAFDDSADGTILSEAVAMVVLKRLEDAVKDGDHIYGVIKGSGMNQDGTSNGITAPNGISQEELIADVYKKYNINPEDITYIEAHGTGTKLGDPIEANALIRAFKQFTSKEKFCKVSSLKPNIGHTGAASGVIGLIKILLSMKDHKIPGLINFKKLNSLIRLDGTAFYIDTENSDWQPQNNKPLMAGLSAFGHSGTNVHMVIQEYPRQQEKTGEHIKNRDYLFPLSAKDEDSLVRYAQQYVNFLQTDAPEISSMAYTMQAGREEMDKRVVFIARSIEELIPAIKNFINKIPAENVCQKKIKHSDTGLNHLKEMIEQGVTRQLLDQIAESWVNGGNIPWELLNTGVKPERISLPTYPFQQEKYPIQNKWDNGTSNENHIRQLYPLLHENISKFNEQCFRSKFSGSEFFLKDHQVKQTSILPGVAYLEMARCAYFESLGADNLSDNIICLKNVVWIHPFNDSSREISTVLYQNERNETVFEIFSTGGGEKNEEIIHCQGILETVRQSPEAVLDLNGLQNRDWELRLTADACYSYFKKAGMDYGPAFYGIEYAFANSNESIAKLSLPESVKNKGQFVLHPSMMDSAFQSIIGFIIHQESDGVSLPFAIDELFVIKPCEVSMWAVSKINAAGSTSRFEILLYNHSGELCVKVKGLTFRKIQNQSRQLTQAQPELLFMESAWKEYSRGSGTGSPNLAGRLVFVCEMDTINSETIEKQNHSRCIKLSPADKNLSIENRYQNYTSSIIESIQNLLKEKPEGLKLIQIVVQTQGDHALFAGLRGILKTAHLENPLLFGQLIEFQDYDNTEKVSLILENVLQMMDREYFKIKDDHIWYESMQEIVPAGKESICPWKEEGVYLITGGVGGLGKIFASDILSKVKKTVVVLAGRSPLDQEKKDWINNQATQDGLIVYYQADVGQREDVEKLINEIGHQYKRLDGIIHSAGTVQDSFILKKNIADVDAVLKPKVKGTVYLDEASKKFALDFFIMFSSVSGVMGNFGQADYAAANAFMNEYADYRNLEVLAKQKHGKTLAVNWPQWKNGGMKISAESEQMLNQLTGMNPMDSETGIQALYQGLMLGRNQVMVFYGNKEQIKSRIGMPVNLPGQPSGLNEGLLPADMEGLKQKTTGYVKKILSQNLNIPVQKIESDALFEKYGIDSVLVMQLTADMEKVFGTLSKTLFFEYQTVNALTDYFMNSYRGKLIEHFGIQENSSSLPVVNLAVNDREILSSRQKRAGKYHFSPVQQNVNTSETDIAIIGLSGRYPGARNIDIFWENLKNGIDSITEIPENRWDWKAYFDADKNKLGKMYSKWGGFIEGVDEFDPLFFNISPKEAEYMDPQERLFLECAYETLEDAGYQRNSFMDAQEPSSGGNVGVFAGVMYEEYQLYSAEEQAQGRSMAIGGNQATIANRVSYVCNFQGPSMAVDTMCSSSLTAIHLACQSIIRGECIAALAGGVNISIHPNKYLLLSQGKFASSSGLCESFGKGGDGYVPGEGVGTVLLKPLSKARMDHDHIYGVIKSSSINAGGKTNGYSVPNPLAQANVIYKALAKAGISANDISYIEAHGTGTLLGDPIEINGLTRAFNRFTERKQYCAIGSVKSNIGHCESAAGISGLTKILLQMKHKMLVPSLHSSDLNPNIDFAQTPFLVQQGLAEWKSEGVRTAGLSSFGAGGANAHLIIQEYISYDDHLFTSNKPALIMLSARDGVKLKEKAKQLLEVLIKKEYQESQLHSIAYTLQTGREAMDERMAFIAADMSELIRKLNAYISGDEQEIYLGQTKQYTEAIAVLTDDDFQNTLENWINKGKFSKILELWVKGLNVDWNILYLKNKPFKISLPAYPFNRERYWLPYPDKHTQYPRTAENKTVNKEKVILTKTWAAKEIQVDKTDTEGFIVILATKAGKSLAEQLFKNNRNIQTLPAIHGRNKNQKILTPDFMQESSGDKLYQYILDRKASGKLLGVVDLTALDEEYENSTNMESGKIRFLQKMIEKFRQDNIKLLQVTYRLNPFLVQKTTLQGARSAGLYRMLAAEYKGLYSVSLDCDSSLRDKNILKNQIEREFFGRDMNPTEFCYRQGVRYVPELIKYKEDSDLQAIHAPRNFNKKEVVFITGGSRGIGSAIAENLVSRGLKNLVILGKEELPLQAGWAGLIKEGGENLDKMIRMQRYIDRGVRVMYFSSDITNRKEMRKVVRQVHAKLGKITEVYHCAGIISHNPAFIKKDIQEFEKVLEPKIKGISVLHEACMHEPLSLFVLFSSVSGIIPVLSTGQSDYAAANSYLDYYAAYQRGKGNSYMKAIQWPAWAEIGMGEKSQGVQTAVYKNLGLHSLSTVEGLDLLYKAVKIDGGVVIPCVINPDVFKTSLLLNREIIFESLKKENHLSVNAFRGYTPAGKNDLKAAIQDWLKNIFKAELKLTENHLEVSKTFDEYGVDSVMIVQLVQIMQKAISRTLTPSLLLEHRSIQALTQYFYAQHREDMERTLNVHTVLNEEEKETEIEYPVPADETKHLSPSVSDEIAVVGIACRFPGSPTKEDYWELLTSGKSAIKPLPEGRWQAGDGRVDYGGWVGSIDLFDAEFFNLKEEDAAIMDPQARVILEESLNALYDAGYEYQALSGRNIGVYIGGRSQPNLNNAQAVLKASNPILGAGQNYLASNISRFFNFNGPSLVLDTACSSGLTAMSVAIESLKSGKINMALAGAVNLILSPLGHEMFSARNILSKNGEFHIFDKRAGGEVLGEGAGVIILKRLSDAITDGNKIYGVIKSAAVNNDGRTLGPGSPNINAQKLVMQTALNESRIGLEDIGYIEVNGGGTAVIDSIEIKAISDVYHLSDKSLPLCSVGSIKPNIGHLLLTSGMAGLIRCLLSVYHKQLPPFLSAQEPADYYDFKASRIVFNREKTGWNPTSGRKCIAALNSFPDGGTNCSVIVEEFQANADYSRKMDSLPVPVMNKKLYQIKYAAVSGNHETEVTKEDGMGMGIEDLINNYKVKQEEIKTVKSIPSNLGFWGIKS